MDGQYWRPNHVNKRVVADIWLLTVSWTLTWEMMRIRNFYCFLYRQHIWLRKWEVIVGDMIDHVGIYGSRVAEGLSAFNVGLVGLAIEDCVQDCSTSSVSAMELLQCCTEPSCNEPSNPVELPQPRASCLVPRTSYHSNFPSINYWYMYPIPCLWCHECIYLPCCYWFCAARAAYPVTSQFVPDSMDIVMTVFTRAW